MKSLLLAMLLLSSTAFAAITEVTEQNLTALVNNNHGAIVIDVYATWCGPCKIMSKTLEEVDKHYAGKVKFVKMDADKNPQMKELVRATYPTVIIIKGNKGAAIIGATDDTKVVIKKIDEVLAQK